MIQVILAALFIVSAQAQMPKMDDLWFHKNVGQALSYDVNNYVSEKISGQNGFDTGISSLSGIAGAQEVIVAVMDTGVDTSHGFIKDSLARNISECVGGNPPLKANEDKDQNGYKGDCLGMDFTKNEDEANIHRVIDSHGHGTHVSGIIASFSRYSEMEVFKKIKILPLKVVGSGKLGFEKRIVKALEYAYVRGAKVVNFSMGWPQTESSNSLRKVIAAAQKRGMIIVAAAGNNSHNSALFPCNYDGVICVGSSQNDGKASRFTNFGSHVDFSAPGSQILSAIPYNVNAQLSNLKGFDKKSGTSQASPIISAYVAALLSVNPSFSRDDVYQRLVVSSRPSQGYSLNGFPELKKIFLDNSEAVVLPEFKEKVQIKMSGMNFNFPVELVKLGSQKKTINIKYKILTSGYQLEKDEENLVFNEETSRKEIALPIICEDLMAESFLKLEVQIDSKKYVLNTQLMRTQSFKKIPGSFPSAELGRFNTVNAENSSSKNAYFLSVKDSKMTLLERTQGGLVIVGSAAVPEGEKVLIASSQVLDLDHDGKDDLFLVTQKNENLLGVHYLNKDLTSILGSSFDYLPEAAVFKGNQSLKFLSVNYESKKIKVPFFMEAGPVSSADFKANLWDFKSNNTERNLYWLEPKKTGFVTRTLTNPEFRDMLIEKSGNGDAVKVDFITISNKKNVVEVVGSIRDNDGIPLMSVSFEVKNAQLEPKISFLSTEGLRSLDNTGLVFPLDSLTKDNEGLIFVSAPKANQIAIYKASTKAPMSYLTDVKAGISDEFLDVTSATQTAKGLVTYLQTKNTITMTSENSTPKSRPIIRHSFLDGSMVSEFYTPIFVQTDSSKPALYVDQTFVNGNGVYTLVENKGELVAPVRWSLAIPAGCSSMNPSLNSELGNHEVLIQCLDSEGNLSLSSHSLSI